MDIKRTLETQEMDQARNVFLQKYGTSVNTNLQRADEIEYAMETQLLNTPKDNYVGLTDVKKPVTQIAKEAVQKVPWQALQNAAKTALGMPDWLTKNQFVRGMQANLANLAREIPAQALTQANMLDTVLGNKERAQKWGNIISELSDPTRRPETLLNETQKTMDLLSGKPSAIKNPFVLDPNDEEFKRKMQNWEDNQKRIDQFNQKTKIIMQDLLERTGIARTERDGWLYDAGSIGSSMLSCLALLVAFRNPAVLAGLFGAAEAQGVYEDAIEAGVEPAKAYTLGTLAGGANAALEQIGGEAMLGVMNAKGTITKFASRALLKSGDRSALTATALGAARGAGVEGSEEALQSIATDVIENLGDVQQKKALDIIKDAIKAGAMGSIGGFFGSGPTAYANYVNYQQQIQTALEGVGIPSEKAAVIARETANEATSQEIAGEIFSSVEAELDSPLTAEQRDVKAVAQVLSEQQQRQIDRTAWKVGNKVEQDSLKRGMKPELAQANGQVAQNITNQIFKLSGLTPAEFTNFNIEILDDGAQPLNTPTLAQTTVTQLNQQLPPEAYDETGKADTNSQAFKNWFGNSKVVDEQGQPLVVYHGTRTPNIQVFQYDKNRQTGSDFGEAYYATTNIDKANGYAYDYTKDAALQENIKRRQEIGKEAVRIMTTEGETEQWHQLMDQYAELDKEAYRMFNQGGAAESGGSVMPLYMKLENPLTVDAAGKGYGEVYPAAFAQAKKNGNDGLIVKNVIDNPRGKETPMDVYIAFNNNQLKSVYNRGTFDVNDANIYNQSGVNTNERNLFATHNMSLTGTKQALKLGGLAMPSMAIRKTDTERVAEFGDVSFVGNENLVKPSRSTEVYDRDAWTPSIYNNIKYRLDPKAKQFIVDVLKKNDQEKQWSMYQWNIQEKLSDISRNDLALDLYLLDKGLKDSNRTEAWNSPEYASWYNEHFLDTATPYLYMENDDNTDMVERKLTLNNIMKLLRRQERAAGGYIGDHLFSVQELIKFFPQKFRNLKELRAKKENLQDADRIYAKIEELDNDFAQLVTSLRTSGQEKEYGADTHAVGLAVANHGDKEIQRRWLENAGLPSDDATLAKVDAFAERMKNEIPVQYFEVKPRRVVEFGQFSGVIMPNTHEYDAVAEQLQNEHGLPVVRIEKGNAQQYREALAQIQEMVPTTFFQSGLDNLTEVHNQVTGEAIPLEMNENLQPFTPVELDNDFLPMAQNTAAGKKQVLATVFGDKQQIEIEKDGQKFILTHGSIKKMFNTGIAHAIEISNRLDLPNAQRRQMYREVAEQVVQALKVFRTSQLVLSHKDVKNVSGRKIYRYGNVFMYKQRPYYAMFVAKQDGTLADLHLYDLQTEEQNGLSVISGRTGHRQAVSDAGISSDASTSSQQTTLENEAPAGISSGANTSSQQRAIITVADMVDFVKRKIAKYNNNVDTQTFNQDEQSVRGQVQINEKARTAIIKIFAGKSDPSTVVHELAHVYLAMLNNASRVSADPEFHALIKDINAWLGDPAGPNGTYSVEQQETFARSFEAYLAQGKAPNAKMQNIFEKFAQWLAEVYRGVKDYLQITPEVSALFDRLMAMDEPIKKSRYVNNTQRAKELLQAIKTGSKIEDSLELADMKTLLKTANTRRPGKPKNNLLKDLKKYGAEYGNAGQIDKEAFANAGVRNKKGGVDDRPDVWLQAKGYMDFEESNEETLQQAYDMIQDALDGKEVYRLEDQERVAQIEAYDENLRALQEVFPNLIGIADTERAIAHLEAQGYRVVDKQDLERLEKEQERLDALLEKQNSKQPQDDKALNRQAQQIRDALLKELDRRALENKEQLKNWLSLAQNPEQIREAVGNVLDYLETEYAKTPAGQAEQSKLEVPHTDYDALKVQILQALNRINTQNADKVKEARAIIERTEKLLTRNLPLNSEESALRKKAFQTIKNVLDNPYRQAVAAATAGIRHLPAADKGKFLRTFASWQNIKNLPAEVDNILQKAKEIEERNYKKYMEGKIDEILQRKLFSKSGTLRTAILDQQSTAAMLSLRRIFLMTQEEAQAELARRYNEEQETLKDPDKDPGKLYTPIRVLENGLLSMRAYGFDDTPPELYKKVYDGLNELRRGGKDKMAVQKMVKDFRTQQEVREVIKAINYNKKAGILKKVYHRLLSNWESSLDLVTSKAIKEQYSMLNTEADTQVYVNQRRNDVLADMKRAYGFGDNWRGNWDLQNKIKELNNETTTVTNYGLVDRNPDPAAIRKVGEPFEETLTKMQIITMYIWNMNPVLSSRLHNSYGEAQLRHLFNEVLTKQDKAAGVLLQREAEKTYNFINEVFIRERGYSLPRVQNYFPSKALRVESDLDLLVSFATVSKNPSFLKSRVDSSRIMMKPSNPMALLFQHLDTAADYHFKAEKINQMRRVFRNLSVKQAVEAKFGEDVYKQMLGHLDQMTQRRAQARYDIDKVGDWLTNNFVKGAIAARPAITIKQLISSINYAEQMPAGTWAKGFAYAIAHPKETVKFMTDGDPYLKTRFQSGSMNEALSHIMAQQKKVLGKAYPWQVFDSLMTLNTRLGDVGAIMFGGKPYVDYLMKEKGMSKEQAFAEFRKATLRSQQAGTSSSLSAYQAQDMNFLMRALFSFKNTPAQYARKIADSLVEYQRGDITLKQLGKNVAIYGLLNSWLYSVLTDLWLAQLVFGDDDDDAIATALLDTFAGPFTQLAGALPILDVGVEEAVRFITAKAKDEKFTFRSTTLPVVDDLVKLGNRALKEDMEFEDVMTLLAEMGQTFGGIPTRYFKASAKGAVDIVTGEAPMRGFLQLVGYTEHRAKKVTGSED